MTSDTTETPTWHVPELLVDVKVCLTCFRLRGEFEGKEHRCGYQPRNDRWRKRMWPHSDIPALVDLCNLCARGTMKSGSSYPLRPDHVTKRLKRLVHDAGLEWIRVHGLRHTVASLAIQNGTDIATVSDRLGHSDTNVTARIYLHGSAESDRQAATSLDLILGG